MRLAILFPPGKSDVIEHGKIGADPVYRKFHTFKRADALLLRTGAILQIRDKTHGFTG